MKIGDRVEFRRKVWLPGAGVYSEDTGVGTYIQHGRFKAVRLDDGKICIVDDRDTVVPCPVPRGFSHPACPFCGVAVSRPVRRVTWAGVFHTWCLDWLCLGLRITIPKE